MDPTPRDESRPFEFGPDHASLIGDLGSKMHFVGLLTIVLGGVALLSGLLNRPPGTLWTGGTIAAALTALILIAVGFWSMRSGREFLLVSQTEGADIPHLMRALENLRRLISLQYNLAWFGLILLVILVVFGYFVDPAH